MHTMDARKERHIMAIRNRVRSGAEACCAESFFAMSCLLLTDASGAGAAQLPVFVKNLAKYAIESHGKRK
jgi:hypothetical protein